MRSKNSVLNSSFILIPSPGDLPIFRSLELISSMFSSVTNMSMELCGKTSNRCWLLSISRESVSHHSTIYFSWLWSKSIIIKIKLFVLALFVYDEVCGGSWRDRPRRRRPFPFQSCCHIVESGGGIPSDEAGRVSGDVFFVHPERDLGILVVIVGKEAKRVNDCAGFSLFLPYLSYE